MTDPTNLSTAELSIELDALADVADRHGQLEEARVLFDAASRLRALSYHDEELRALQVDVVHRVKGAAVLLSETSTRNDRVDLAESIAGGVDQIRDYAEAVTRNAEHQIALKGSALARLEKAEAKIRALTEWRPASEVPEVEDGDLWYSFLVAIEKDGVIETTIRFFDGFDWDIRHSETLVKWRELPEYTEGR